MRNIYGSQSRYFCFYNNRCVSLLVSMKDTQNQRHFASAKMQNTVSSSRRTEGVGSKKTRFAGVYAYTHGRRHLVLSYLLELFGFIVYSLSPFSLSPSLLPSGNFPIASKMTTQPPSSEDTLAIA